MQSNVCVYLTKNTDNRKSADLLRKAAGLYTGKDTSAWQRAERSGGKPFFSDAPDVHFSVSHSGGFWACSFGNAPLGLDLQQHKDAPFAQLARRVFCAEEAAWLQAQNDAPAAFYRIWTAKESYLKRIGSGFPAKLPSFNTLAPLPDGSVLQYLAAPDGYTMCLCTKQPETADLIWI